MAALRLLGLACQLAVGLVLCLLMPILDLTRVTRRYNNCWWWAARRYIREGGVIAMEPSEFGWWGHFKHSPDGRIWTAWTRTDKRKRLFPPPVFRGVVGIEPAPPGGSLRGPHRIPATARLSVDLGILGLRAGAPAGDRGLPARQKELI